MAKAGGRARSDSAKRSWRGPRVASCSATQSGASRASVRIMVMDGPPRNQQRMSSGGGAGPWKPSDVVDLAGGVLVLAAGLLLGLFGQGLVGSLVVALL